MCTSVGLEPLAWMHICQLMCEEASATYSGLFVLLLRCIILDLRVVDALSCSRIMLNGRGAEPVKLKWLAVAELE